MLILKMKAKGITEEALKNREMLESIGVATSEIDSQYIDVFVPAHNIKMVEQAENNIFILSLMTGEELEVEGNPFETATSYRIPS